MQRRPGQGDAFAGLQSSAAQHLTVRAFFIAAQGAQEKRAVVEQDLLPRAQRGEDQPGDRQAAFAEHGPLPPR